VKEQDALKCDVHWGNANTRSMHKSTGASALFSVGVGGGSGSSGNGGFKAMTAHEEAHE